MIDGHAGAPPRLGTQTARPSRIAPPKPAGRATAPVGRYSAACWLTPPAGTEAMVLRICEAIW